MKPGLVERLLNMSGDSFSWGEPLTNPIHIKIGWRYRPRLGEEQGLKRLCDKSEDPLLPPQSQVLCVFPAICTVTLEAFDPEMADYRNLRVKCGQGFFFYLAVLPVSMCRGASFLRLGGPGSTLRELIPTNLSQI